MQGVTGIIERRLFPNKYADIPKHILDAAAMRGSHIHKMCELVDDLGITPEDCQEATNYKAMKERLGLVSVASEYLVSDGQNYASSIDVVYEGKKGKNGVILNDRKTTSKLDKEYLSWQLSIYAYFFELINPEIEVEGLTATWLRGEICEYVDIDRKPVEDVQALLLADINDEPFDYYPKDETPSYITDNLETMTFLNARIKALQNELAEIKTEVEGKMLGDDLKSVITPMASFSYIEPKTSIGFDEAKFKAENPELYEQYKTKETTKKGYLTIKFK